VIVDSSTGGRREGRRWWQCSPVRCPGLNLAVLSAGIGAFACSPDYQSVATRHGANRLHLAGHGTDTHERAVSRSDPCCEQRVAGENFLLEEVACRGGHPPNGVRDLRQPRCRKSSAHLPCIRGCRRTPPYGLVTEVRRVNVGRWRSRRIPRGSSPGSRSGAPAKARPSFRARRSVIHLSKSNSCASLPASQRSELSVRLQGGVSSSTRAHERTRTPSREDHPRGCLPWFIVCADRPDKGSA